MNVAPANQNQPSDSIANIAGRACQQSMMILIIATGMIQFTFGFGPIGGTGGAAKDAAQPMIAISTNATETINTMRYAARAKRKGGIWPQARSVALCMAQQRVA